MTLSPEPQPKPQFGTGRFDERPVPETNPRPPENTVPGGDARRPGPAGKTTRKMPPEQEEHPIVKPSGDPVELARQKERVERVRAFMKRKGLTQGELSRVTGIPGGTLSQVLKGTYKGKAEPRWLQLERYMDDDARRATYQAKIADMNAHVATPSGRAWR